MKCQENFHHEEREQIRNCRNEEGDLVREDHAVTKRQSRKRGLLRLLLEKSSKDLQRSDFDNKLAKMVLSGLSETEEAETFAWDLGNCQKAQQSVFINVYTHEKEEHQRKKCSYDVYIHIELDEIKRQNLI